MISPRLVLLIFALLLPTYNAFSQECSSQQKPRSSSARAVKLNGVEPSRSFYVRSDHYAILVERAAFIDYLELQVKKFDRSSDQKLLAAVKRVVDVSGPIDAFSFAFENPLFLQTLDHAFADIL